MTKNELIERIQRINPTATTGFLLSFPDEQLQEYLDHLAAVFGEEQTYIRTVTPAAVAT